MGEVGNIATVDALRGQELRALNNSFHEQTSLLDASQWSSLIAASSYAVYVQPAEALLIAFTCKSTYDNPNFRWFAHRFESFVYVDRIVVSANAQGKGYGRRLYEQLFLWAQDSGFALIGCEVNQQPPNPGSDAFHERMGFVQQAQVQGPQSRKVVAYLTKTLANEGSS